MKPAETIAEFTKRFANQLKRLLPSWKPQIYDSILIDYKTGIQVGIIGYSLNKYNCYGLVIKKFDASLRITQWSQSLRFETVDIPEQVAIKHVRSIRDAVERAKSRANFM